MRKTYSKRKFSIRSKNKNKSKNHSKRIKKYKKRTHRKKSTKRLIRKQKGGNPYDLSFGRNYIYVDSDFDINNPYILSEKDVLNFTEDLIDDFMQYEGERFNVGAIMGCFCPPHKGHYDYIKKACEDLDLNILFLGSTNSGKGRHGIPPEFSIKQLCNMAAEISSTQGAKVFVSLKDIPFSITSKMTNLYIIETVEVPKESELAQQGITKEDAIRQKEYDKNIIENKDPLERTSRNFLNKFDRSTPQERQTKVQNKVYIRDGDDGYSATQLTKCLMNIRDNQGDYGQCFYFLPDFYTDEMKYEYINDAMQYSEFFR